MNFLKRISTMQLLLLLLSVSMISACASQNNVQRFTNVKPKVEPLSEEILQTMQADPVDDAHSRACRLDANAHRAKCRSGGKGVLAFQESGNPRHAIGQCAQHDGAMRNGLVARHTQTSTQSASRLRNPIQ